MNDLILFTTKDGRSQIKLQVQERTVSLTQLEMAELFDATKQNTSLNLKNALQDGELDAAASVKESLTVRIEGSRHVQRSVSFYNLDATGELYLQFDKDRKTQAAIEADQDEEADQQALEAKHKRRPKK